MNWIKRLSVFVLVLLVAETGMAASEVVQLNKGNYDAYAPKGKEADAIYGDYVLRNEHVVAVIANPIPGRNANMTTSEVGGNIIDLTVARKHSDQLTVFYAGNRRYPFRSATTKVNEGGAMIVCKSSPVKGLVYWVTYELKHKDRFITVKTTIENQSKETVKVDLYDGIRADRTFGRGRTTMRDLGWIYDEWWRQAYGVMGVGDVGVEVVSAGRSYGVKYKVDDKTVAEVGAGKMEDVLVRRIIPGSDSCEVREIADALKGVVVRPVVITVNDDEGGVADAVVTVNVKGKIYAAGYTDATGKFETKLPDGEYKFDISASAERKAAIAIAVDGGGVKPSIKLAAAGYVAFNVKDSAGGMMPAKVQFIGKNGTKSPMFFDDTGEHAVRNCYYTVSGEFKQAIGPGEYDVIISRGNEYDAVFTSIKVTRGAVTKVNAALTRSVKSPGWVSAEYHSHSSPSGDNTSSQYGRVLNLLAEHLEYAPCTEHNRIDSYVPHLKRLKAEHLMATCTGMELTGSPLPINHHNVFPLKHYPRTQDGGGPQVSRDPAEQISRLYAWDNYSEKLIQQNHPNLIAHVFDRNLDGKLDEGYQTMLPHMDVVEVHPHWNILNSASISKGVNTGKNRMHSWLMMLNQGHRVPGVVNTDSHYNFHGSGWLRNYVKSSADDPAKISTSEMVQSSEKGHIIMTNGPYLEVLAQAKSGVGIAGDELVAMDGKVKMHVRVQCPNWHSINRVQIIRNGRLDPNLNFTSASHPKMFMKGVVKFDQQLELTVEKDEYLIVVAIGDGLELGPVVGPSRSKNPPTAVSNPIYIDTDGNGYRANGDLLDSPEFKK